MKNLHLKTLMVIVALSSFVSLVSDAQQIDPPAGRTIRERKVTRNLDEDFFVPKKGMSRSYRTTETFVSSDKNCKIETLAFDAIIRVTENYYYTFEVRKVNGEYKNGVCDLTPSITRVVRQNELPSYEGLIQGLSLNVDVTPYKQDETVRYYGDQYGIQVLFTLSSDNIKSFFMSGMDLSVYRVTGVTPWITERVLVSSSDNFYLPSISSFLKEIKYIGISETIEKSDATTLFE